MVWTLRPLAAAHDRRSMLGIGEGSRPTRATGRSPRRHVSVDGYASRPILRALVHRGGLRADILEDGELRVRDRVEAV
jgi:hypothetical protein